MQQAERLVVSLLIAPESTLICMPNFENAHCFHLIRFQVLSLRMLKEGQLCYVVVYLLIELNDGDEKLNASL